MRWALRVATVFRAICTIGNSTDITNLDGLANITSVGSGLGETSAIGLRGQHTDE